MHLPSMTEIEDQWYWDRRNNKAYFPVRSDEGTTTFLTVWHREEVQEALQTGVVFPVDEIGHDRTPTTFDLIDSFRLPAVEDTGPADR